ncbi:MAG TPA: hypothetical protein VKX25_19415 [Bryobacteraceae bacterium]|jgi:hypothetical protein|nr:hypothetical protein [Bryobacteraceae bacterium]
MPGRRAAFVFLLYIEEFVRIEKIDKGIRAVENLMVPPDASEHRPEGKAV